MAKRGGIWLAVFLLLCGHLSHGQSSRKAFKRVLNQGLDKINENPTMALDYIDRAYEMGMASEDSWAIAMAKAGNGYLKYNLGDHREAYLSYFDALVGFENSDTVDLSNTILVLNELSLIQSHFGNHSESIKHSQQALSLTLDYVRLYPDHARRHDQLKWLIDIPYYIYIEYEAQGDYRRANEILTDLWKGVADKDNIQKHAWLLNELGLAKFNVDQNEDAIEYYNLIITNQDAGISDKSVAYHNMGFAYLKLDEYEKAIDCYMIALKMDATLKNYNSQFVTYLDLGEVYFERKLYREAIEQWSIGLALNLDLNTPKLFKVYSWLDKAHNMLGEHELANTYDLLYKAKKEEFESSAEQVKAEQERQDFREFLASIEKKKLISKTSNDYVALIVILTAMTIGTTIMVLVYLRKKKQKRLYRQLGDILLDDKTKP